MQKVIRLQLLACFFSAGLAAVFFGLGGAVSAGLAGLACVLPNAFFAWRLMVAGKYSSTVKVSVFFAGELLKVLAIAGLLVLLVRGYPELHWGAFLMGVIITLQAGLFAFLLKV